MSLAVASGAQAYIYWVNQSTGSIGRANLDGTGVNQNFITGLPYPAAGVAVDPGRYDSAYRLVPNDTHIYWTNGWTIEQANPDGSDKNVAFILGLVQQPMDVAAYNMRPGDDPDPPSNYHRPLNLVWTEAPWQGNTFTGELVGSALRYGYPGQGCWPADEDWIHPVSANHIAVGATDYKDEQYDSGYVYWTGGTEGLIGRANLNFASPTVNERFIITTTTRFYSTTEGVAVRQEYFPSRCTNCGYIYWINRSVVDLGGWIGRAKLDGTGVMPDFINLLTGYSADAPQAVAVDPPRYDSSGRVTTGGHLYRHRQRTPLKARRPALHDPALTLGHAARAESRSRHQPVVRLSAPGEDWTTYAGSNLGHLSVVRWSVEPRFVCAERTGEGRGGRSRSSLAPVVCG